MEKADIEDTQLNSHLETIEEDRMDIFLLAEGSLRGAVVHGSTMINEMRANHELGILETLTLGHAYIAAALMSSMVKGRDRIGFSIECGGPIKGLQTEANALGEVRGFLSQVPIPVESPLDNFDLSPFFGPGFLTVTKTLQSARNPFSGKVMLQHGNIGEDLAYYFHTSEQTPTAFHLSVQFDREGRAVGAGGLFLQVLGGIEEASLGEAEQRLSSISSPGRFFSEGGTTQELIQEGFSDFGPDIIATREVKFFCGCRKERFGAFLAALKPPEKEDIRKNGPFPLRTTCYYCGTTYEFSKTEIEELFSN